MKFKTPRAILVPVDFSDRAENEAVMAARLAQRFGARLILLHVVPGVGQVHTKDPAVAKAYEREFEADIRRDLEGPLQSFADRLCGDCSVECRVVSGEPSAQIEKLAREEAADLIVMSTSGAGRFRRFLLGSVTRKVLHDLDVPVLTGAHMETPAKSPSTFRRIGALIELDASTPDILDWARAFAAAYGAELRVLHVAPALHTAGAAPYTPVQELPALKAKLERRIHALLRRLDIDAPITVEAGEIEDALPRAVAAADVDLIITGRNRPDGLFGLAGLRQDLHPMIRDAPRPVLSLPETPPTPEGEETMKLFAKTPKEDPVVRNDHLEDEAEHAIWLEEAVQWRDEHRRILAMLAKTQAAILEQDAALDSHLRQIHRHEMLRLRHELTADPKQADELAATHRTLEEAHAQARQAHKRMADHHDNLRKLVEELTAETERAM